jgi:hypothetical protein
MFVMLRDRRVEVRNAPNYGNNPLAMADTCVKQLTSAGLGLRACAVAFPVYPRIRTTRRHAGGARSEVDLAARAFPNHTATSSMPPFASSRRQFFASRKSSCCLFGILCRCGKLFIAHLAR